ncbi:MAG: sulfotransferase domain-containing protein [Bacteroidota bacterium]|nr:sulfotransferase domain-containing protein [Bacteroidota bacterium]
MKNIHPIPNLIIPGFPKSGTSALFDTLIQHPAIVGGKSKEPHIYSFPDRFQNRFTQDHPRSFSHLFGNGETDDVSFFLEASTSYMISVEAADRIKEDSPDCKFIIVARDPVERVLSHYNWIRSLGIPVRPFRKEIEEWKSKPWRPENDFRGNFKNYLEFSNYGSQIQRYFNIFPKENFLILSQESLKGTPDQNFHKILDFLQLERSGLRSVESNVTRSQVHDRTPSRFKKFGQVLPQKPRVWIRDHLIRPIFKRKFTPIRFSMEDKKWIFDQLLEEILILDQLGLILPEWRTVNHFHATKDN